jgi:hypothetical protein
MKKYVVTKGEDEGNEVLGVFSSKEKAQDFIRIHKVFDTDINDDILEFEEDDESVPVFLTEKIFMLDNYFCKIYFSESLYVDDICIKCNKIENANVRISYNSNIDIMRKEAVLGMNALYNKKIREFENNTHWVQKFAIIKVNKEDGYIEAKGKRDVISIKIGDFPLPIETKEFYARATIDEYGNTIIVDNIKSVEDAKNENNRNV